MAKFLVKIKQSDKENEGFLVEKILYEVQGSLKTPKDHSLIEGDDNIRGQKKVIIKNDKPYLIEDLEANKKEELKIKNQKELDLKILNECKSIDELKLFIKNHLLSYDDISIS